MVKVISTDNGDYQKAGLLKTTGGIMAGGAAYSALSLGGGLPTNKLVSKMQSASQSCDNALLRQSIKDAFEQSALAKKGTKIIDVKDIGLRFPTLMEIIKNPLAWVKSSDIFDTTKLPEQNLKLQDALIESMPKRYRNSIFANGYASIIRNMIESGQNAGFIPNVNKIGVNIDKLGASTFHEMGHAINFNFSKFWRGAQKMRTPMMIVASILPTIALFKRKKVEGEEPKNVVDKVTTFIKNNVGKLTTLAFVPIVAEELMATKRGNKMAKQLLPKEMFKKVKACNRFGAASYVGAAVLAGVGAVVASKIRDAIAKPKQVG